MPLIPVKGRRRRLGGWTASRGGYRPASARRCRGPAAAELPPHDVLRRGYALVAGEAPRLLHLLEPRDVRVFALARATLHARLAPEGRRSSRRPMPTSPSWFISCARRRPALRICEDGARSARPPCCRSGSRRPRRRPRARCRGSAGRGSPRCSPACWSSSTRWVSSGVSRANCRANWYCSAATLALPPFIIRSVASDASRKAIICSTDSPSESASREALSAMSAKADAAPRVAPAMASAPPPTRPAAPSPTDPPRRAGGALRR